jgi:hypothetical protein
MGGLANSLANTNEIEAKYRQSVLYRVSMVWAVDQAIRQAKNTLSTAHIREQ